MSISKPQLSPSAKSLSALSTSSTSNEKERLMKALQQRKSQMQKRAQETKRAEKAGNDANNASPVFDNKENIGLHSELRYGKGRPRLSSISEHDSKDPPSSIQPEIQQPITAEPNTVEPIRSTQQENAEKPVVETGIYHSGDLLPDASYSSTKTEQANLDSTLQSQIPPSEHETDPLSKDSAGSTENDIIGGSGSPSAVVDVPPADNLERAPEKEEIIIETPSLTEETPVTNGNQRAVINNLNETIQSQSVVLPQSPVSESRSESRSETVTDSSTIHPSNSVELQNAPPPEAINTDQPSTATRKEKRKPFLEPIQVPTPDYSDDDNLLSDDSFMEELKSATVEEAKPISVVKSPLSPGHSNGGNSQSTTTEAWRNSRAVSNPSAAEHQPASHSELAAGRSVSSPFSPAETSMGPLVAKKINVSSGISKRIKALEQFSGNGTTTPTPTVSTPPAASFGAIKKRASVSHGSGTPDAVSRHSSCTPEPFSRTASLKRPDSRASTNGEPAAVSVTARIIHDPDAPGSEANLSTEPRALNLRASPLTVERGTPEGSTPQRDTPEAAPSHSELRSMSASPVDSPKPPAAALPRSDSRQSASSKNEEYFLSKSPSEASTSSPEEKKQSRTSRLLRRMSSITSPSRRSTIGSKSPAVQEEETVDEGPKETKKAPATVDIGELNVQFPDTLLWKRRFIRIDDKGFLVLTPGNVDSSNRNMVKQYHLNEFRIPCIPDEERQELSNSIMLDFLDGSTLQFACESRQGQEFVLQSKSYHI